MKRNMFKVVAGSSLDDARSKYMDLLAGNAQAFGNGEMVCLASASDDQEPFNPMTGEDDLTSVDIAETGFEATASESGDVNVHYTICTDGCGAHILAESDDIGHCVACASDIEFLDEAGIQDYIAESNDESDMDIEGIAGEEDEDDEHGIRAIACGFTKEEAIANYRDLITGVAEHSVVESEDDMSVAIVGTASTFDVTTGARVEAVDGEQSDFSGIASGAIDGFVQAEHFVCSASSSCGLHVISSDAMPVFCPECSSGLLDVEDVESMNQHAVAVAGSDDEDDDFDLDMDEDEDEDEDEDDEEDDEFSDDDADEDDADEDEIDEDDESDSDLSLGVASAQPQTARMGGKRRRAVSRMTATASAGADVAKQRPAVDSTEVEISYSAIASANFDIEKLDVGFMSTAKSQGRAWVSTYAGVPVAMATQESANRDDIFQSETFGRAFLARASQVGLDAAHQELGFQPLVAKVPVADFVEAEVADRAEAKIAQAESALASERNELHERFKAALEIASAGINRGFFANEQNPVKQSLVTAIAGVGIDGADALVANAFANKSDEYHRVLLAKAFDIMQYAPEVQNQLAVAVQGHAPQKVAATASAQPAGPLGRPVGQVTSVFSSQEDNVEKQAATASSEDMGDFMSRLNRCMPTNRR
jgi:hypothetical protein